jgi:endonuclease IV
LSIDKIKSSLEEDSSYSPHRSTVLNGSQNEYNIQETSDQLLETPFDSGTISAYTTIVLNCGMQSESQESSQTKKVRKAPSEVLQLLLEKLLKLSVIDLTNNNSSEVFEKINWGSNPFRSRLELLLDQANEMQNMDPELLFIPARELINRMRSGSSHSSKPTNNLIKAHYYVEKKKTFFSLVFKILCIHASYFLNISVEEVLVSHASTIGYNIGGKVYSIQTIKDLIGV